MIRGNDKSEKSSPGESHERKWYNHERRCKEATLSELEETGESSSKME